MATDETRKFKRKDFTNWKPTFLAALAETGMVGKSARRAGIIPLTARRAKDTRNRSGADLLEAQIFGKAWAAALEEARETLGLEMRRRAIEGVERERKIFYHGEHVGSETVKVYSDRLLMYLMELLRVEARETDMAAHLEVGPGEALKNAERIAQKRWEELLPLIAENEKEQRAEEELALLNEAVQTGEEVNVSDEGREG